MIASANRLRSVGWVVLLGLCLALVLVLAFRVNALRSQIHQTETRIVALKQEKLYLETEFETRSNQQQLKAWNDVEFGYAAPGAGQYLEGERQLAALSVPTLADAPAPIRVASVDDSVIASAAFPAMVSPLSGKPLDATAEKIEAKAEPRTAKVVHDEAVETLNERLGKVVDSRPRKPVLNETASEKDKPSEKHKATAKKANKPAKAKTAEKAVAAADKSKTKGSKVASAPRTTKGKEAKAVK
jgi:hypothetical protein